MNKVKWSVDIIAPKAKRMSGLGVLRILIEDGWGYQRLITANISQNCDTHEFELDEEIQPFAKNTECDGLAFYVTLTYTNSSGSRKETLRLTPRKVEL